MELKLNNLWYYNPWLTISQAVEFSTKDGGPSMDEKPNKIMNTNEKTMFEVWRLASRSKMSSVLLYLQIIIFTTDDVVFNIKMVSSKWVKTLVPTTL